MKQAAAACFRKGPGRARDCDGPGDTSEALGGEDTAALHVKVTCPTQRRRGGGEGLRREEDSELGFWEPSLISVLFLDVIGTLQRKFTFNPPLTSQVSPLVI